MSENLAGVAWLGTGLMGAPMACQLIKAGYRVVVWNRSLDKAKALLELGGDVAESAERAVAAADVVFTMLSDGETTAKVLGKLDYAGKTVVQMGTIGPRENQSIAKQIAASGGQYLEAPVLGSIPEAKSGKLIIMAGGKENVFEQVLPMLKCIGPEPRLVGNVGQASAMKLALNQLIASLTVSFSTSLAFAQEYGVNVEIFMQILRESALYAPTFDKKLAKMQTHDFHNPNFPTEHLIKDIKLFSREATQIDTGVLDELLRLYQSAQGSHMREDYSCVYEAVAKRV